ncbi:MAG: nucleoside hydrolase [Bacteroidales bacterium]
MKKIVIILTVLLFIQSTMYSNDTINPRHHIIIDTDCAIDDLRAINLLLSSGDTEVMAITSADGTLEPEEGFLKIKSLLKYLGHEGIPVSKGITARKDETPEWRDLAHDMNWGKKILSYKEPPEVKEFLVQKIEEADEPIELVCLGPLTNIANAIIMKPEIIGQIERIIWFDQCQPREKWTNYGMDCLSADYILNKEIPIITIRTNEEPGDFSKSFYESIGEINTPYAQNIHYTHSSEKILNAVEEGTLKIWDELAALYVLEPELFEQDKSLPDSLGKVMKVKNSVNVKEKILKSLESYNKDDNILFNTFPADTSLYRKEIQPVADTVIRKYGIKEWKAVVMTTEIHGHVGLYSIIGAKMGVRALEYFRANGENTKIESHAGKSPPLSCMNDGLQVASGNTVGNGSFSIIEDQKTPEAIVHYKNRKLHIQLETQYLKELERIISKEKEQHGMKTKEYWENIKQEAVEIWKKWDRKEIFKLEESN